MAAQRAQLARIVLGSFTSRNYPLSVRDSAKITNFITSKNFCSVQPKPRIPRIFSAVCVQRLPQITKEKSELGKRYEELQDQLELEHSALSEDEVEWEGILERKRKLKDDDDDEIMAIGMMESERKQFEEEQEEELRMYQPGSRQTEADKITDLKSLHRKLQDNLILLVRHQKDSVTWELPCGEVTNTSDTLQQVASESLSETCGTDLKVQFLSNAPIAVMKKYKNKNDKVFFYKVNYVTGCVRLQEGYFDHIWVTRKEMKDFVDADYFKTIKRFIF